MSNTSYEKFGKALNNLRKVHGFLLSVQNGDTKIMQSKESESPEKQQANLEQVVKGAVVNAFNICHEMLWKHLKKYLEGELAEVNNSPKAIYKTALKSGTITKDMAESLNRYHEARINSAHDYAERKGETAIDVVADFIEDATELYEIMTAKE